MNSRLGDYEIVDEIGRGGMGVVYRARDGKLGRMVALKVLPEAEAGGEDTRRRLRLEARAAAILNHPSIVTVFDYEEADGRPFIVYEFVEGRPLAEIASQRTLPESEIADIGCQVAEALAYAHERGILHRDIKPANLLLTNEGRVKVLDFGLAKRTGPALQISAGDSLQSGVSGAGTVAGTPHYMAPEQLTGEEIDGRVDLFALGVVLFELATGVNPFKGDNFASTVSRIMAPEVPEIPADCRRVSPELADVIRRCLQKNREDRYPSARSLLGDLQHVKDFGSRRGETTKSLKAVNPIPRRLARTSLVLLQILYLMIYLVALVNYMAVFGSMLSAVAGRLENGAAAAIRLTTALLASGCCGIAVRMYLLACVGFNHPETGRQFRRLFPFLMLLDEVWALAPLMMAGHWPEGVSLVCVAVLAYLPITHRNLIRSAYP